jgi:outer membrane protein assembly factor BamB
LKKALAIIVICFFLFSSLIVISESNQVDYINDNLRFICINSNGFNEEKLQQMSKVYNTNKKSSFQRSEVSLISIIYGNDLRDSSWPMFGYNARHIGRSPVSTSNNNGAVLWRFKMIQGMQTGVSIDGDGTIYFGCYDGDFYALNSDGSLKWKYITDGFMTSSTPAINNEGTIYIGSWDNYLHAVNPDGTLEWMVDLGKDIDSSPVVADDGTVYVGTMGGLDQIGYIVSINLNGTINWKYETGYHITSSPAVGNDGTVYIGSGDTYVYALYPNGTLRWRFKTDDYIKGPPSIADNGTVYIGSWDGYLYALNPSDGNMIWKCKIGSGTETNPSIGPDGTIYVGGNDLYAVNPDGTMKWIYELGEDYYILQSSPAVSADGTVFVGTSTWSTHGGGDIIAVNADGSLFWRWNICSGGIQSSPCIGSDGRVYIGACMSDGNAGGTYGFLYCLGFGSMSPPNLPTIEGATSWKVDEAYQCTLNTTDPEGHDIFYKIDWGDGEVKDWRGPYESGESVSPWHTYIDKGTYTIRAKAKDEYGLESDWSTLEVTMPKSKTFSLLGRLIERWSFFRFFN